VTDPRGALLSLGKKTLASLSLPAGWGAELYLEQRQFREAGWAEKRPEDTRAGRTEGMALRVLKDGRQGFAFANEISPAALASLWEKAAAAAALSPPDPARRLPSPPIAVKSVGGLEKKLFGATVRVLQKRLAGLEKKLLAKDRRLKKALKLSVSESLDTKAVVNSQGVAVAESSTGVSFSAEVMGQQKGEVQVGWAYAQKRFWKDLDMDAVMAQARDRVLLAFGAGPLPSGNWPVIVDPWVGVEFLDLISDALTAEAVQRGRSFFAGLKGQPVASRLVTLLDDGRLPKGLATATYDDEGRPTQTTTLIDGGTLREFFYDTASAAREGRESTGHAMRPGIAGPPSAEPTNFYMKPGHVSRDRLIAGTTRAFLLQDVLGMHTADAVSGDFSVGASGLLVERGRVVRAVKGVTLAGNILDLLKHVDAVASDLTWHGSAGAPTFRVSALSVGGS